MTKKFITKSNAVDFLDPECSVFIISCELADFGVVIWQKNCENVKLSEPEVLDCKITFLVQGLFDDMDESRLERLKMFNLGKTRKSYGINKTGEIVAVLSRPELIYYSDGSLAILLRLRSLNTNVVGLGVVSGDKLKIAVIFT